MPSQFLLFNVGSEDKGKGVTSQGGRVKSEGKGKSVS